MGIFDLFGKKDVTNDLKKALPFGIRTEFVPYKLKANTRSSSTLMVNLKNITSEPVMSSVVVQVPERISLDSTGLSKEKEVRLGTLGPNEAKDARIELFSSPGTDKGEYTITITAFIHYRDYAHVLNAMKKRSVLEAV
ncbi:MAG: hypothetical protein KGH64_03130 [Candidatus Micrarchaeota archaeon]|nr:hypothetical protein [Candidatus Micrarchaeota archaeon]MDE1859400.1 hypothetical protein [Candidatus Micrarchaeota archaeon]